MPGTQNVVADALSRILAITRSKAKLAIQPNLIDETKSIVQPEPNDEPIDSVDMGQPIDET